MSFYSSSELWGIPHGQATILAWRGFLKLIDNQNLDWTSLRFKLQTELLLYGET